MKDLSTNQMIPFKQCWTKDINGKEVLNKQALRENLKALREIMEMGVMEYQRRMQEGEIASR